MKPRLHSFFGAAAACALLLVAAAHGAEATSSTIKFSDPSRPGTVKLSLGRGDLHVQGSDAAEVVIKSEAQPSGTGARTKDGLRVISSSAGFSFTEKDNVITIDAGPEWGRGQADFHLTVPHDTSLVVQNAWGGDFRCIGLSGDIEVNSMQGEIRLDDVSGGIVASTMNGEIHANIRELREGKPLSFTSMNGEVVLRVPENAKANVRLRTQNGSVLTDFDDQALQTKAEATSGGRGGSFGFRNHVLTPEIQQAIRDAAEVSATAVKEALEAVKEGLAAARINAEEARHELDHARREIDRARRDAAREDPTGAAPDAPAAPGRRTESAIAPPAPPRPPRSPAFTFTGGKLVTGTLNGGGPEISVATMNGDVILRKRDR